MISLIPVVFHTKKTGYVFPVCSSLCGHDSEGHQHILRTKPASKRKWEKLREKQVEWEWNPGKTLSPIDFQGDSDGHFKAHSCLQAITWLLLLCTHEISNVTQMWVVGRGVAQSTRWEHGWDDSSVRPLVSSSPTAPDIRGCCMLWLLLLDRCLLSLL